MKRHFLPLMTAVLIASASVSYAVNHSAYSHDKKKKKADTTAVDTTKKAEAAKPVQKAPEKKSEWKELMKKDSTFTDGLFRVRHIEDKYYFEVPDSMLGRYLLAVTRFTSVPQNFGKFAGEEVNENTVYFEKRDKKTMLLRAYVLSQLADANDNISKTLNASTTDPIVASFKIVQDNPSKDMSLIDVTRLFMAENEMVGVGREAKTLKLGGLMPDRTFIDTMKVYPINIEIGSTRTYSASAATPGSRVPASYTGAVTIGLNTSLLLLPKEPMRMRIWDERVGYFTQRFTRFSDAQHKTEPGQMIARYRLVPKDVKAYMAGKLVEPVKPIVYYIDPATPKKWVPYLIKGINDWNVAFEAAGFKNAIQGKEWPKDRPDMSVDDARYCVIRYLPAEIENAYGPHVSDPRSGEIMESHICWYHNVMSLLTKWYMTQCGPLDKRAQTMHMDDKLMGELIRFVSSHEVGHTLGLRHNMGSSAQTPVEKLRDKAWVEKHGHTASIMDYARFNYVAQPEDGISEKGLFPRINDYDKWAIKWGYQYRPEFKDEYEEKTALRAEVTKVLKGNPRLVFTGEGRDEDPRSQTEDLGDNSMKASDYGIKNLKRVMENIEKWTKQEDGQTNDLRDLYSSVTGQYNRYVNHVVKNISGRFLSNLPDTKAITVPEASRRAEVVDWMDRNVFEAPMWLFPQSVMDKIGYDALGSIQTAQANALQQMLAPRVLNRLNEDTFVKADSYSVDAYLADLFAAVWKPVAGNAMTDKARRNLQSKYVENLNSIVNPAKPAAQDASNPLRMMAPSANNDVVLYIINHLDMVEKFCLDHSADAGINGMHYKNLAKQIKRIREKNEGAEK